MKRPNEERLQLVLAEAIEHVDGNAYRHLPCFIPTLDKKNQQPETNAIYLSAGGTAKHFGAAKI